MSEDPTSSTDSLDALRLRIDNATYAEKAFLRYCFVAVVASVLVLLANSDSGGDTVSILGKLDLPRDLVVAKLTYVRVFLSMLVLYGLAEWVLAIVDLGRHPLALAYCGQLSLAVHLANAWDGKVRPAWLKAMSLLALLQNLTFLILVTMVVLLIWS